MGLLPAIETTWFDAVEIEIVAGTIQYMIFTVERDDEGRAVRRPIRRLITTVEVAQQGNIDAATALMRAGHLKPALKFAGHLQ